MEKKSSSTAPIMAAVLIVGLLLMGCYVGGYFWLGEVSPHSFGGQQVRFYAHPFLATAYKPAALIETAITGDKVTTMAYSDP